VFQAVGHIDWRIVPSRTIQKSSLRRQQRGAELGRWRAGLAAVRSLIREDGDDPKVGQVVEQLVGPHRPPEWRIRA